jgi:hypothetical protein
VFESFKPGAGPRRLWPALFVIALIGAVGVTMLLGIRG